MTDYVTIKYDPQGNEVWVARYNGPANWSDDAKAIALDLAGNVYVTGSSGQDANFNFDHATIKYDPNGNQVWVARYNGPGNTFDGASAIALDAAGNVYVTGASRGDNGSDYATIKYSQSPPPIFVRSLFFPRLVTDPNQFTGIAIVNLDTSAATMRCTAFERINFCEIRGIRGLFFLVENVSPLRLRDSAVNSRREFVACANTDNRNIRVSSGNFYL